jgi:hypothetical protein
MIKISVYPNATTTCITGWWMKFSTYYESQQFDMGNDSDIFKALAEWRAINIVKSEYIAFQNEQDLTLFMLRWL